MFYQVYIIESSHITKNNVKYYVGVTERGAWFSFADIYYGWGYKSFIQLARINCRNKLAYVRHCTGFAEAHDLKCKLRKKTPKLLIESIKGKKNDLLYFNVLKRNMILRKPQRNGEYVASYDMTFLIDENKLNNMFGRKNEI